MRIETDRLIITEFTMEMAKDVHENSLDADNRRFMPDEVFETIEEAQETLEFLMSCYGGNEGPFVYPCILKETDENIGYVEMISVDEGWEIGYHIGEKYAKQGYATEAVKAFLPRIMQQKNITEVYGICIVDNISSRKVMERCGFIKSYEGIGKYQGKQQTICKYKYVME